MTSEDRIRALRAASNAALARGDVDGFMASIDDDYVVTVGNGGHLRTRMELEAAVRALAEDPDTTVWFVRTPGEVEVDSAAGRGFERGDWVQHTRAGGVTRQDPGGRYVAYWRRVSGRWKIHAELFVALPRPSGGG